MALISTAPHRFMVSFISKLILEQKKRRKISHRGIERISLDCLSGRDLDSILSPIGFVDGRQRERTRHQKKNQLISQRRRSERDDEMDRSNVQSRFVLKHMYHQHSVFDMSNFLSSPHQPPHGARRDASRRMEEGKAMANLPLDVFILDIFFSPTFRVFLFSSMLQNAEVESSLTRHPQTPLLAGRPEMKKNYF
jgi:hypothetical protein